MKWEQQEQVWRRKRYIYHLHWSALEEDRGKLRWRMWRTGGHAEGGMSSVQRNIESTLLWWWWNDDQKWTHRVVAVWAVWASDVVVVSGGNQAKVWTVLIAKSIERQMPMFTILEHCVLHRAGRPGPNCHMSREPSRHSWQLWQHGTSGPGSVAGADQLSVWR